MTSEIYFAAVLTIEYKLLLYQLFYFISFPVYCMQCMPLLILQCNNCIIVMFQTSACNL